ncbi:methyltransferase [Streptomyces sp. NPDC057889]|uniref:methyltransferase n=1 Tax=unclassified Streptomyces TaxID=2593676 RepID=UPI003694CDF0
MSQAIENVVTEQMQLRASLIERIGGLMTAHAIGVVAELGIADLMGDQICSSGDLAERSGTDAQALRRLLRLLASAGVTTEPQPDRFALTPIGDQLRSDSTDSLRAFARMFCHPILFQAWKGLEHSVRTGEPAFDHIYGTDFYGHIAGQEGVSALFNEAMSEESRIAAAQLAAGYDFSTARKVVDLGGGDGTLLAAILGRHSGLQGIVFDSPSGVAEAPATLEKTGLSDRCEARAGDFFQDIPADGDLYIIKSVFQDWSDEDSVALLRSCHAQMPSSATLLIIGTVLPETATPDQTVPFFTDLNMMVLAGGRERTEREFRSMLTSTGFTVDSVLINAAGPLSIIQASPAAA